MCKVIGTRDIDSLSAGPTGRHTNRAQDLDITTPNREALHHPMNQNARTTISINGGAIVSLERENSGFSM